MTIGMLADVDFSSWEEPDPNSEPRELLESWLRYQRHEFIRKLRDLSPDQVVAWSVPPVELSVLGLVRHMTQMEHVYLSWGLGGGERALRYGEDDYAGGTVETIEDDLRWYFKEVALSDAAIGDMASLDTAGAGHGRPLRATLVKMVDEYADPRRSSPHAQVRSARRDDPITVRLLSCGRGGDPAGGPFASADHQIRRERHIARGRE